MVDVVIYIKNNCNIENSYLRVSSKELFFQMDNYKIVIKLNDCSIFNIHLEDSIIFIDKLNFINLSINNIDSISIKKGTPIYNENGKQSYKTMSSYTYYVNKLYQYLNELYVDSIKDIETGLFQVWNPHTCDGNIFMYGVIIYIKKEYWDNNKFIKCLTDYLNDNFSKILIPQYYSLTDILDDDFTINFLPSNTKIRRLGYLKIMLRMFDEMPQIPISIFNRKFEKYAQKYNFVLNNHHNNKGIIVETKTGNSAIPYIELANSLGIIHKAAMFYEVGKVGRVYSILKEEIEGKVESDPFLMTDFDITFFLEYLLKKDYMYIYVILQYLCKKGNVSYNDLKCNFRNEVINRIRSIIKYNMISDSQKVLQIKMIEKRIMAWEKNLTYMEHVLMPRINWLGDLGLIDFAHNKLSFTNKGKQLYYNMSLWEDLKLGAVVNPNSFINRYYMRIIDDINESHFPIYNSSNEIKLRKCLDDCFILFKTLAPNRATFSLAATYCKNILYWRFSKIIDIDDIKFLLEKDFKSYYIYKYQLQYNDGYIQKRN